MTDVAELTTLGRRLLIGDGMPPSPAKSIATLREAAARGGGEAAALLSICAASGIAQARNVDTALDHLAHAAELGWEPALCELQLLARDSGSDPAALRRKVDVASWRSTPPARVMFAKPRIVVVEHFATADECQWLIGRAGSGLMRAKFYRGSSTPQLAETRTNREMSFTIQWRRRAQPDPRSDRGVVRRAGDAFRDREASALLAGRAVRAACRLHRGKDAGD